MAYIVDTTERDDAELGNLTPSFGAGLRTSIRSTFRENASTLIYDAGKLRQANAVDLPRLPRDEAEARVKAAGVKLPIPEDSYTPEALDLLIQRQKDNAAIALAQERTPWSWIGTPIRGGAQLLTGVVDPLNIASAFIPVVREQRAGMMLARAGESLLARAGVRAGIGAAEGAAGAALLEPLVYGLHSQLRDDYGMADSLVNLAFGTLLGGGLHATVGAVADLRAPRLRDFTVTDAELPPLVSREAAPGSAASVVRAADPEVREVALRAAIADMAQGRAPEVDAVLRTDAGAAAERAVAEIAPAREAAAAEALATLDEPTPAAQASPAVARATQVLAEPRAQATAPDATPPAPPPLPELTLRDLRAANAGATRLSDAIDAAAQRSGSDPRPLYASEAARLRAAAAEVPPAVAARYTAMADMIDTRAAMLPEPKPPDLSGVHAAAQRQRSPEASALADAPAAAAASERLAAAPKDAAVESAKAELDTAMQRLQDLQRNLEAGGMTPEQAKKLIEGLKPFDEAIADAKNIGDAVRALATCGNMT